MTDFLVQSVLVVYIKVLKYPSAIISKSTAQDIIIFQNDKQMMLKMVVKTGRQVAVLRQNTTLFEFRPVGPWRVQHSPAVIKRVLMRFSWRFSSDFTSFSPNVSIHIRLTVLHGFLMVYKRENLSKRRNNLAFSDHFLFSYDL